MVFFIPQLMNGFGVGRTEVGFRSSDFGDRMVGSDLAEWVRYVWSTIDVSTKNKRSVNMVPKFTVQKKSGFPMGFHVGM